MDSTLLLVILFTTVQYASPERFFVVTKPGDPCPGKFTGEPCLTITQFVSGSYTRFLSNPSLASDITLDLQQGEHQITNFYDFLVRNMDSFALRATSTVILDCKSGYFNISNVQRVQISGIKFINCYKNIVIKSVTQLTFENCELAHGEALWIRDATKAMIISSLFSESTHSLYVRQTTVMISQSMFVKNCVGVLGENSFITVHQSNFINNTANCALQSTQMIRAGGAIHLQYNAIRRQGHSQKEALTIVNSTFEDNKADNKGGAIYVSGINIKVNGSMFVNNKARLQGGAVYIASTSTSTESTSVIYSSKFISNHASIGGGAIYAPASVIISESAFIDNTAHFRGGGAVYTGGHYSNIEVTKSIFRNNSAAYCGAFDVDELHHKVKLLASTFSLNTATGGSDIEDILKFSGIKSNVGGVICIRNASVLILDTNFTHNMAAGYGGVMYVDDSTITIEKSNFDGNRAGYDGGVIYTEQHRIQIMIAHSSFTKNRAHDGDGGVMYVGRTHSQVSINESTFSFNSATERGGVIVIYGGELELNYTDFHNNSAQVGGEIGIACNSEIAVSHEIVTSKDPEFSFCNLYEEQVRQYHDNPTGASLTDTPKLEVFTTSNSPTSGGTTINTEATTMAYDTNPPTTISSPITSTAEFATKTASTSTATTNHIQTTSSPPAAVYFELNSDIFLNNSAISLQDIGEGENALTCVTDNQICCGTPPNRHGEFYYPSGEQVPIRSHGDKFYRQRGYQRIYLNRRVGTTSPAGTYTCVIPNATGRPETLYIDLL